jgi:CubicO group peptidase (beta-lactamase class C family)
MNKMFTAVATLQLVEAGKLSLDDTVGKHLPNYPNKDVANKVRVRHLLSHTGGTGDIFGPEFTKNRQTLRTHSDYVKLYGERGLAHEPGAGHRYSNYGYVLLGVLIEKVSGVSYYEYVRRNIFRTAGMTSTDSLPESTEVSRRAVGYTKRDGKWVSNADTLPWRGTAAGGGYSTARDLLRFAMALESGTLISEKTLVEATTQHVRNYGYGFTVAGERPLLEYGHSGGAPGMSAGMSVLPLFGVPTPPHGIVSICLSNLDPPIAQRLQSYLWIRASMPSMWQVLIGAWAVPAHSDRPAPHRPDYRGRGPGNSRMLNSPPRPRRHP